jgi:hypothetical protein
MPSVQKIINTFYPVRHFVVGFAVTGYLIGKVACKLGEKTASFMSFASLAASISNYLLLLVETVSHRLAAGAKSGEPQLATNEALLRCSASLMLSDFGSSLTPQETYLCSQTVLPPRTTRCLFLEPYCEPFRPRIKLLHPSLCRNASLLQPRGRLPLSVKPLIPLSSAAPCLRLNCGFRQRHGLGIGACSKYGGLSIAEPPTTQCELEPLEREPSLGHGHELHTQ